MTPVERGRGCGFRRGRWSAWCALLGTAPAVAAPWNLEPTVSLQSNYESNPQYYQDKARAGWGELVNLTAPFSWDDGRTRVSFIPSANSGASRGAVGIGAYNRWLTTNWTRASERSSWRASASWSRLDMFGVDRADLGTVRPTGTWDTVAATAGMTIRPGERSRVDVDLSSSKVNYDVTASSYVDYRYSSASAQYSWSVSEAWQLEVVAETGNFQPGAGLPQTHDRSLQVGFSHELSETLVASLTIGRSRSTQAGSRQELAGAVYSGSVAWTRQRFSVTGLVKRSIQPGSYGDLSNQTDYSLRISAPLTERLTLSCDAGHTRYEDKLLQFSLSDRQYRRFAAAASYMLTEHWRLDARAGYERVSYGAPAFRVATTGASSVGVSLGLTRAFGPTRLDWSRFGG